MALKIRRGLLAELADFTPAVGELIFATDTDQLFIGDGTTEGGVLIGPASSSSLALGGNLDLNGNNIVGNGNININGTITATGNITLGDTDDDNVVFGGEINSNVVPNTDSTFSLGSSSKRWANGYIDDIYSSTISATSLTVENRVTGDIKGSVFGDDSVMLVDGTNGRIVGPVFANVTGDVTGNVTGNLDGNVTGNVTGNLDGNVTGDLTGNVFGGAVKTTDGVDILVQPGVIGAQAALIGNVLGDLYGSVFATNSTRLVDGIDASINLNGTIIDDIIPAANEAYDIGSTALRFKDLYLSGNTIYLGSLTVSNDSDSLITKGPVKTRMPVTTTVSSAPTPGEVTDRFTVTTAVGIKVGAVTAVPGAANITVESVNTETGLVVFVENFVSTAEFTNGDTVTFFNPAVKTTTVKDDAPTVAIGQPGDTAGMIAYNGTYLYVCVANYDGSTEIWKRSQWTAGAW
jgi:trimeric autotransporter adhesin